MYKSIVWGTVIMAAVAAIAYILMGMGVLTPGNLGGDDMPIFFYIIPLAYLLMGVLVLSRWRRVRIVEAIIVLFTIVVFYAKYADQPDVMWSAPGLITKLAQILMLAGLIYLILKTKPVKNSNVIDSTTTDMNNTDG